MELLERSVALTRLAAGLDAARGHGRVVLVSGEAGIGKTILVRTFVEQHVAGVEVLAGACDPLLTPRALGPLHDMAAELRGSPLAAAVATGAREAVFAAFADRLGGRRPSVMVIEDAHWADEATLDFLVFIARRLARLPALVVVTYRDEDPAVERLRAVAGRLPADAVTRIRLEPLSVGAVAELARRAGRRPTGLHALTDGNPLLVTELLRAPDGGVPPTVSDLVVARLAALPDGVRRTVHLLSVVPTTVEPWLAAALQDDDAPAADAHTTGGLLEQRSDGLAFRHELLRRAIEESLPGTVRRAANERILDALEAAADRPVDPARLAHHAREAADRGAVVRHGIAAARRASAMGAHREAVAHYRSVLAGSPDADRSATDADPLLPASDRAELLEGYSVEAYLAGLSEEAVAARLAAVSLREAGDDPLALGEGLRWLSRLHWWDGDRLRAEKAAARAIAVLERCPPGQQLAMAYSTQAQLDMLGHELSRAVERAHQALELARRLGDPETITHALTNIGSALLLDGDSAGRDALEESFALAVAAGMDDHAARAIGNLATIASEVRLGDPVGADLDRALAFVRSRELAGWAQHLLGHRARHELDHGDWTGAEQDALAGLAEDVAGGSRVVDALVPLALVQARRGDPEAADTLERAGDLVSSSLELQWVAPVTAARAEYAWLHGEDGAVRGLVADVLAWAQRADHPWFAGELAFWAHLAGAPFPPPSRMAEPHRLMLTGTPRRAADAWAELGWPYHRALALAGTGADPDALAALALLDGLGARQAAWRLRRDLRRRGVRVPRGPIRTSSANPHRLTVRQLEVLVLLADGLTDAEIAGRLSLSVKTVGHHVSAVLAKTGATSRRRAADEARRLGLVSARDGEPRRRDRESFPIRVPPRRS